MAFPFNLRRKKDPYPNKAVFVNCVPIDDSNRIGCAMLTTIAGECEEPLWLLVPVDPETAQSIKSVTINYKEGYFLDISLDRRSQRAAK